MSVTEATASGQDRESARAKRPRSAVTSGRKLFVEGDPNSAWSRTALISELLTRLLGFSRMQDTGSTT